MAELADKLAKGASELRFLLTQHKVADDIQGELYANGVDTSLLRPLVMRLTSRRC